MSDISSAGFARRRTRSVATGVNVDTMVRNQRRLNLLQTFASDYVSSSPAAAMALAESSRDDDEMLNSALEASDFASVTRLQSDLAAESKEVQRTAYSNMPRSVQQALNQLGYVQPEAAERGGKGRLFGSIPVIGDAAESLLDWGTIPGVGGALEEAQHFLGEGLQPVGQGLDTVLKAAAVPWDQVAHAYRATVFAREEGQVDSFGWGIFNPGVWTPSEISKAWRETGDEDDSYIRPEYESRARRLLEGNDQSYKLAFGEVMGKTPEEITTDLFGFEPGSLEAQNLALHWQSIRGSEGYRRAMSNISSGQVSFGRIVAQEAFGLEDTSSGLGRHVSGLLDAGVVLTLDPLLIGGKATRFARFGRNAFRLNAAGAATALRHSDLGLMALRAREGANVGTLATSGLHKVSSADARLGRHILSWADRVARGFSEPNGFGPLIRDMPDVATGLGHMSNYHVTQQAQKLRGLDTPLGVIEYLQDTDGLMSIMATRVGGASPMAWGYRMPTFTPLDRKAASAKEFWQRGIDWASFVGQTPDRVYGPKFKEMIGAAGNPRKFGRQSAKWLSAKTIGSTGRTLKLLTSHTPYRDMVQLSGPDSIPEFTRLVNMGIFSGLSRQTMDNYISSWVNGGIKERANLQEHFLNELFRAGGVQDTRFADRFVGRAREAYAIDPASGSRRLVDVGYADALAIPDVRAFLGATSKVNLTRAIFHHPTTATIEANLARFWKPAVLLRLGFIARAAGEELLHTLLKNGPRVYLGSVGAGWVAKNTEAKLIRGRLELAEAAGHADEINRLRHALAETEGSMFIAPIRALMAGSDRMVSQLFRSSAEDAGRWRRSLHEKAERFDPNGPYKTVSGFEQFADNLTLATSGLLSALGRKAPGELTKARLGELMAQHWNPETLHAARMFLRHPSVARAYAENISGGTMTPWEFRNILDADGMPVPKVNFGAIKRGEPVTEEIELRALPGEAPLDRVLDDPNFYNSLFTRHGYTRNDRVERAVVDNVLPRYMGGWEDELISGLGYDNAELLRTDLNQVWSHQWSDEARARLDRLDEADRKVAGFDSGEDALRFLRRYIDGDVDEEIPAGWVASRLKDLFDDAGVGMSGGRFVAFLDDAMATPAAKRWLLYDFVSPDRLIRGREDLLKSMKYAARGRLARPDMYPALRSSRLYSKGDIPLARPVERGVTKVYVPLMPPDYMGGDLTDDFIEAATQRIFRIGGYGPDQARTIAQNVAAASVGDFTEQLGTLGMRPLAGWASSDPRITEAIMGAAEDVTGIQPTFGILAVPDEVIERSTDQVLAQGLRRAEGANDFAVEGWRLNMTHPTEETRRYVTLDIGEDAWDKDDLDAAMAAFDEDPVEGMTRVYSTDRTNWDTVQPDAGPFWFADVARGGEAPRQMLESFGVDHLRRMASTLGIKGYSRMRKADLVDALQARPEMRTTLERAGATGAEGGVLDVLDEDVADAVRIPGPRGTWGIDNEEVSEGLGEIKALEEAADRTVDEITETLTTLNKTNIDDDVLHEIVEPLKRPDRYVTDDDGVEHFMPGYNYSHLVRGTSADRLPTESYGPKLYAARWSRWGNFVREWFDGPVNRAISSIIRKPMFLNNYGRELANVRGAADVMVDRATQAKALEWAGEAGIDPEDLDQLVEHIVDLDMPSTVFIPDEQIRGAISDYSRKTLTPDELKNLDLTDLERYARQRHHATNLANENALNRAMQLTIPYIDDHRIRSAFQGYVGTFIPFMFAEEQFLKRWIRSAVESPEMIRKAQLAMNGLRAMGTVRRDDQGREIFTYPLVGDAIEIMSGPVDWITGGRVTLPYEIAMTGDVGYTLPGFGDQMGVPSAGPLVGFGVEVLSRMFPELAEAEDAFIGRGANRPLWQYFIPSGAAKLWEAGWGDIDQGQLASATIQAIQTMAINGQLPPETATPEERQEFIDRARSQARFILAARGMFGMTAPAAPVARFEHDDLTKEFTDLLQADVSFEDAIRMFLATHPEAQPADILAATVFPTEAEFSGLEMPTDEAFKWVTDHEDLVQAYPAASAWLTPRASSTDTFSQRAYNQQLAMGLRRRKDPKEFIDDIYFRTAAQDYFDARSQVEEHTRGLTGPARSEALAEWAVWKDSYFKQHPLFSVMLQDPSRQQKRTQAIDQLIALSGRDDDIVPPELKEMMGVFEEFQQTIAALKGDRRDSVRNSRASIVSETVAWLQWHIARHPHLSGPYLRLLEPELRDADEEAVMEVVDA